MLSLFSIKAERLEPLLVIAVSVLLGWWLWRALSRQSSAATVQTQGSGTLTASDLFNYAILQRWFGTNPNATTGALAGIAPVGTPAGMSGANAAGLVASAAQPLPGASSAFSNTYPGTVA